MGGICPHCGVARERFYDHGYIVWACPQERMGLGQHPSQSTSAGTWITAKTNGQR